MDAIDWVLSLDPELVKQAVLALTGHYDEKSPFSKLSKDLIKLILQKIIELKKE